MREAFVSLSLFEASPLINIHLKPALPPACVAFKFLELLFFRSTEINHFKLNSIKLNGQDVNMLCCTASLLRKRNVNHTTVVKS